MPFSRFPDSDGVDVPVFGADEDSIVAVEAAVADEDGRALTFVLLAPVNKMLRMIFN